MLDVIYSQKLQDIIIYKGNNSLAYKNIIISTANFATAILLEAGLSFLGLGIQPPVPSWGMMIKNHYLYILIDDPYLAILPGLCIVILVLSFMSLGNVLRDVKDVKLR